MGLNGKQLLENFKEDEAYGNTTYTPPANDDDSGTQTGLLDGLLGKVGAAADWVNNNIEYVEKSPVGQWVGNNVEWLESTPVGQALAPSNSVIKNLPVLLGLAINASVTPKDDDTFGGSAYNALANGEANVIGTMADFLHQDDLAASMRALANKTQDDTPVAPGLDWDYISSPHGLTRSTFNAAGSMIPILPSVFLAPEGLVAAAGRISPWLANGARFGMTAIPEAMAEGGQTRREAIEDGLDHPDLRAIGTAAKNLPLLAVSNTLEGAVLGGGLGKALAGKAGESVLARMAKAPLRATPSALVEGLQQGLEEGLQQGIQDSSLDKEHGWLPWNWNDEQWQNAAEGFWGTLPLGAIGGARKAVFPGNVSSGGSAAADSPLDQAQDDIDSITSQTAQQSVIQSAQQDMENNPYTAPTAMQDTSYEAPSDTSSGSSYDASALEGDPQYTISGEVSSTDVTPLTDQKMRLLDSAYYNKYGQHLYITSMKRNGNPDESWHNSGQAFDTADDNLENNKEARDWLISEGEKLGLTPLDEYEHPSAGATGGHIHFSDHGEPIPDGIRVDESDSDMDDSDMDDSTGGVDLSNLPVGDIAMDIAQNTNLPVNFIWSQLSHESDGGKSKLAVEDHNYGGVKGNDGEYLHFDNDQQFIDYMSKYYPKYREDGIYDAKTADQFAEALQHGGYFTADLGEYEGGMHRYLEQAGLSQDAMFGGKARRAGRKGGDSTSSTPDLSGSFEISADDPAMDSMFASFAKDWQNMSTDANEINFFGDMFNSRNKFKATEENKQAILDNYGDAFRQYVQENQPQTVQAAQTTQTPVQPKQTPQPQHIEVHTPNLDSEQAKEAQMHAALAPKIFKPIDLAPFKGNPAGALGYLDELRQVADNFNYNKDYIRSINEQMHKIGTALGVPTDDSAAIYDALNNDQRDSYNYEFMRHRRDTLQAIHDYPIHPQQKQQVGEYIHMLDEEIARLQGKAAQAQAVQQTGAQATPQSTPQAPAQKVHIATATPKQENALASISDGTIAAAKQADDGFSAPLNIFSADEQKALRNAGLVYDDANYNGAERVKVDPLYEEGDRRMKSGKAKVKAETKNAGKVDKYKKDAEKIYLRFKSGKFSADDSVNQLENLKKKATSDKALSDEEKAEVVAEADNQIHRIKPQKETKEHETQKYSSKTAETAQGGKAEGYPHQDAEPEPRKAADTQRKAEESEVSATKKAADKGGRDEQTLSEKEVVLKHISTLFGKPITNKETGIVATFGTKGANKMVSNKAVDKTVKNGYSQHEHLEAVKDIKRLYEDAGLSVQHEDRDKSPNILSIKRFRTNMTTVDGNPATAKITVKETKQNGHKIYSIELEALEKPSELNHARADSSEGQTVRPTKGKQPSSAYADESSSSTHIIPHEQKEGTKNLDSANVPAMGEPIHGIKDVETTVITDSGKENRAQEESDTTSDIHNANAASTEDRSVETNPRVLSYKRKAQEIVSSFEKRKVNLTDARQEIKDLMAKANEERWGQKMSNDECMAAQGFLSDALSKLNTKQAKKRKARKSATKAKAEEKSNESIFGSVEDADKEMLDALGLSEEDLADDVLTAPDGIKNTAEERERLEKELSAELNKMSAMPMFNPKIYTLGLKLAMTYVKDGINTVKKLVAKLNAKFGDKIGPWAPALAETVRTWPKGVPFDEKKVMAISKAVGARYENGITSLDGMQADMKKLLKGQHDSFAPMIEASYNGIRKFFEAQKGENNHADDSTSGLAERAGRGSDSDAVGADDAGGESGRRSGRGVQEAEGAVRPEGGVRVRDRSAAAGGEAGNRGVQVEESGDRAGSAGSAHVSRSVSDSYEGSVGHDADRTAASIRLTENRRDNASPAGARARDVKPNKSGKRGDLGSIKNDLPMLQPEQQEDVEFIETRVNVNNKPGVMLTNGTGTGKTYSGLGFVKRMYDAGKKNILIVSPSESINDQWIEAANKHFELSIEKLSSTKDSGKDGGICITTYANLQANRELVNRNWDAVVSDESHTLMQNEKGEETGYLSMLRALTMNPRGAYKRFKLQHRTKEIRSLENQIEDLEKKAKAILRPYGDKKKISSADKAKVDALQKEIEGLNKEMEGIFLKMSPGTDKLMQDLKAAYPEEKRPKVLFLSATPFSHDKDIDYAEGYLFHYDEDTGRYGGYNVGTPSDQFMVKHFGYRMRTGKLTRPDAEVDSRAMEVQFHDDLVNSGAMHGRQIAVDKDYDRGFILVDGGIGHKIDEGFKFLSDNHAAYGELYRVLSKQFNKSQQKYLIESIKAREVIPLIREYVKKGKKVVLFHQSMVEHKNIHPFQLKPSADLAENSEVWAQWKAFKSARPDLVDLSLGNIPAPMETLRKELSGHAVFINGNVPKKDRAKNIERFNDDDSGVNIIVCQQDAANAGISLHDTTGKHPRVLINIAMPERPSYAMQIEGRIYRVGNASNAVFRYLSTGTDIEKNMFASTIGGRAASVENLAVGNAARGLRESFRDLYQETMDGSWKRRLPGAEGEGTGGKELDYAATSALSDYDRAKSFYFAQQKRTARTKAQEGNDYFATPEPIGYKMVEWLGLKSGEKALEPSAGHGAISRWFPETTERTIVEPSAQLAPIAQMNTPDAKVVHTRFEDFNIVNKFDGIAMNPPFGTGGKTAVEHLQKAFHHLRDGGRVIAILPEGPAADKRLDKLLDEIIDEVVRVADIHLPAVAFTRAGTKVMTHIVVLDRYTKKAERDAALANIGSYADIDLRHIDGTKELFDRLEGISLPDRTDVKKQAERAKDAESQFTTDTYEHTKTHEMMFKARPRMYLGDSYREVSKLAKEHGGYYSRYADNSFLFKNEEDRDAFVKQADELLGEKGERYSAEEQQEEQARALDELKQEVRDALPGARDIRDDGNRLSFTMPNGAKVEVQLSPSIEVSDTEAGKARAAHGIKPSVRVKINGRERTIGTTALVELSQLGRKGSAYHEAFHAIYDLCLTEKEKAALHRAFDKEAKAQGRDVYEVMADKYRDWMIAKQKGQHTLYGKLWQKVKDAAARLARVVRGADNAGDVFRKVASGEAWERPYNEVESDTRYAAEQKGAQSFIKAAASKLGKRMGVKSDKIITEEAKAKEGIGILDYLIASPSRVATRVKSFRQFYRMGVRAMDVLTERRSYYQRKLGKAMKLVKNKNDYEELTDILLSGDAEGKEWTKEELIQSGTKENVAEAYARIRRLMRQAYKMVNEAHKHPKTYSKRLSDSKIEELRQNPFVKIMKIHDEEDDGRRLVTYREFANYEHTLEGVTKQALDGMRVDEDMQVLEATKQADGTYKVRVREGRGDVTNRKGYIPHFFHNYMVEVRDEDGNYVTTITSGRTQREAVKKAEEWMKDNKLEDGQKIYIHPKIFDFTRYGMSEKGIVQLGDKDFYALMNRVAKDNDMSLEEAKDLLQNVHQKNRHRFFGNVLHRKGVSGFETDMNYVLSHYFNSASRYYAMETEFKPQAISLYERLFGDFAKDSKNSLAQYVKDYINDVNGTPSALERGVNDALMRSKAYRDFVVSHYGERAVLQLSSNIAGATTYMCLGYFNVSSALLNLTQVMNSAAYIGDVSALGKCLSKGMHRKYSLHDLKVLKETNVLNDIGLDSGSGYDVNRMSAKSLLGKINKAGMSFFKVSEQTVRIGTVLTAYESGIKRGMSHEEAIDFAKEVNQKSNFNYSVADAPNIFRRGSFLSQLALQFKKYGIKELEVMADMLSPRTSRKQKLIFWGTYLLAAGLCGLPALDWLDEVLGWVFGKSPKLAAQEAIMEATGGTPVGKFIGRMAMYGLPSSLVGVDLSSRVGMSDVVPTKLKNFLPPLATKIPQFMQDIFSEAKINAVRDFSPAIYNQIAAWGTGKSYDKRGRINAEYNTFYDKLLRSIGFKSTDERVDSDIRRITSERRSELNAEKQKAVDAYIAHPTPQNMQKLKDLGIKDSTVEKERERKKEDSYNRTKGGMTKKEAQENRQLLNFK